jgi:phosphomannomutase
LTQSSLKFGTSGLRGLADELNGVPAYAYTSAFAEMLKADAPPGWTGEVLIGRDLRRSSPDIAALCGAALSAAGLTPLDAGEVPTPALALHGQRHGLPSLMVTGSHIPDDRNGLKFYRASGEIDKADEIRILALHAALAPSLPQPPAGRPAMQSVDVLPDYTRRYTETFGPEGLKGLRVGVYQHSSVARDLMVQIVRALGAEAVPLGRSDSFVPVDTEALREEDKALALQWASETCLDAIISTDGDADRPLVADETGQFLRGDLLGVLSARQLGAEIVVTPVTSNSGIETSGAFSGVRRTRVGSPFVIEAMVEALRTATGPVLGFEANGGVLLGSAVPRGHGVIEALMTRDAMLPILCALSEIAGGRRLSEVAASAGFTSARSDRLKDVDPSRSAAFLDRLGDAAFVQRELGDLGSLDDVGALDGVRIRAASGDVVHFRASGNAPELRVYVEAAGQEQAGRLLAWALGVAERNTR